MSKPIHNIVVAAACVAALFVTGCAHKGTTAQPAQTAATVKPPLVVPSSFASENDKRAFLRTALSNGYYAEVKSILEPEASTTSSSIDWGLLGTSKYNLGDYSGAIDAWTKAASADPRVDGEMHNNIGNALRDQGKIDEAQSAYETALKQDPNYWTAAVNLADMLRTNGELKQAVAVLENAMPSNQNVKPLSNLLASYKHELSTASHS